MVSVVQEREEGDSRNIPWWIGWDWRGRRFFERHGFPKYQLFFLPDHTPKADYDTPKYQLVSPDHNRLFLLSWFRLVSLI